MRQHALRRAARAAIACAAATAFVPAAAEASTWTVDDDRVQCPNAKYTSIQAAVNQAAPWDTVKVCDGVYYESSTPASTTVSPSQTGSRNGLTITKPLTIKGTGASKVSIRPAPSLAPTLAGTAPYLRDSGGNVVSVSRQAAGSTDDNENRVDISGVTIESPDIFVEAGISYFNTSGTLSNSKVGPLKRAADSTELAANPHGWGVVMTNHLIGAEAGIQRQVNIVGSLITGYQSGGVLFDDSRGTDGSATTTQRSGIKAYGRITQSTIQGSGPDALIPQTGVQWHAGQRGSMTDSTVTGNLYTPDLRRSVGVLLTDAETGADPSSPTVRGWWATYNRITQNGYGMFNADIANSAVRLGAPAAATPGGGVLGFENYWGCSAGPVVGAQSAGTLATSCQGISGNDTNGAASIERGTTLTSAMYLPATPAATVDAVPSAIFEDPVDGAQVVPGEAVDPVITATDDFGVKSVSLSVDGEPLGTQSTFPYTFSWSPTYAQIGSAVTFTATVVDSSGQTSTATSSVEVVAPDGYVPLTVTPGTYALGDVLVGESTATEVTVDNTGENPVTLGALALDGDGFALGEGTCTDTLVLAPGETCTAPVTFAPEAAGAAAATLTVPYATPGGGPAAVVDLTGTGTTPPPPIPTDPTPTDPTPPTTTTTPDPPVVTPPAVDPPPAKVALKTSLASSAKVSKTRAVAVGTLTCGTATTCTTKVTATLKIGKKTYRFTKTVTAKTGRTATIRVTLSKAAQKALRTAKGKRARMSVSLRGTDSGGGTSTRTKTITVKG
jgi:hypothetical protein